MSRSLCWLMIAATACASRPTSVRPVSSGTWARGAPAEVTAFVGVNVVPMDTERVLANQTVVVQNGRILALGPRAKVKTPAGTVRIDGEGKYFLPGLADMHAHLGAGAYANRVLLIDYLVHGVTTIRNVSWDSRRVQNGRVRFHQSTHGGIEPL